MLTCSLQVRRVRAPVTADGWYLRGDDARAWLDTLAPWWHEPGDLRLFGVPRGVGDRRIAGLLVLMSRRIDGMQLGAPAQALVRVSTRLWLPADAQLDPPLQPAELDAILPLPVMFLHPTLGLCGFAATDELAIGDLLAIPRCAADAWQLARPPTALPRLIAVEAAPQDVRAFLDAGADGIGAAPPPVLLSDASPGSKGPTAKGLRYLIAGFILRFTDRVPQTATRRTWVDALEAWARRLSDQSLHQQRQQALQRLLELLHADPERGLRQALPLVALPGRGLATPSGRLSTRSPDFDSGRLRGGRPTDGWHLAPEVQARLAKQYRLLAVRELRLGRHRRAAYIFAELLGDLRNAALALENGRHYREAAGLYRDHLNDAAAAARTLLAGGLLSAALALYRELDDLDQVVILLERLQRDDEARAVHHARAARCLQQHDPLGAARIFEVALGDCERALEVLRSKWPTGDEPERCLDEFFRLLLRHGLVGRASRELRAVLAQVIPDAQAPLLVRVLARLAAAGVPDDLAALAADGARTHASRLLLAPAPHAIATAAIQALILAAPGDRLLRRDVERFSARLVKAAAPASGASRRAGPAIVSIASVTLPAGFEASTCVPLQDGFLAFGHTALQQPSVVPIAWSGMVGQRLVLAHGAAQRPRGLFALALPGQPHAIMTGYLGAALRIDPGTVTIGAQACSIGTPRWLPDHALAIATLDRGAVAVLHPGTAEPADQASLLLSVFDPAGTLLSSEWVALDVALDAPVAMAAAGHRISIAAGAALLSFTDCGKSPPKRSDTGATVRALIASPPFTRARVLALFERGAGLAFDDHPDPISLPGTAELHAPVGTFTTGGVIIVAAGDQLLALRSHGEQPRLVATGALPRGERAVTICAGPRNDEFVVVATPAQRAHRFRLAGI